jgi:hypothetical protein
MAKRILPDRPLTRTEIAMRWRHKNRDKYNIGQCLLQQKWREQLFVMYGRSCNCCDETNVMFLTLDHVNNDGNLQRKALGHRSTLRRAIIKEGYRPDKYQILCMNCNWGKRMNGGTCPHQKETIK